MNQIFRNLQMDESLKVSITDSTMMRIVHRSMDRAHKRVKSKNGPLERLSEISKFYLLAVMQLEGCLKFVQDQTDNDILESSREQQVLADLTEIRDRLKLRLEETDMAFLEKDKELRERSVNELKLRQALEMKERELVSLRVKFAHENHESRNDTEKEEEFSELKHSVDQQVLNIKQQLEPDYESTGNRKIDTMGSDINFLKETLDLAFGKMHTAIFLSELGPKEHEWMWDIERGTTAIMMKEFLKGFQESFDQELRKRKVEFCDGLSKNLLDLMKEIHCLHDEIELLSHEDAIPMKSMVPIPPQTNPKGSDTLKGKGKSLSEGEDFDSNSSEGDSETGGENYVAKMVKNHESIIRRKSEELNHMKREILRERACAAFMKREESSSMRKKVQKMVGTLETLINCLNLISTSSDSNNYNVIETQEAPNKETSGLESFEEVWAKVSKISGSHEVTKSNFLKLNAQSKNESCAGIKMAVQDDVWRVLLNEMVTEWKMEVDSFKLTHAVTEEMQVFILSTALEEAEAVSRDRTSESSLGDDNERKNLTQTLDRLFKSLEKDEALMLSACAECNGLDENKIFLERSGEKEDVSSSVCCKLEEALQQIGLGKALLSELQSGLGLTVSESKTIDPAPGVELSEFLLTVVQNFSNKIKDFERVTHTRLRMNAQRLGEMNQELEHIVELVVSLSKRAALYRNAFIRRCENLHKAENEVDVLADQVEGLLGFLEKIYKTLHQYSPLLQHYFEVSDILKLIQIELSRTNC